MSCPKQDKREILMVQKPGKREVGNKDVSGTIKEIGFYLQN